MARTALWAISTLWMLAISTPALAEESTLLHTPGYQSPTVGGPGDVVVIRGWGLPKDGNATVVYQRVIAPTPNLLPPHPVTDSTANRGFAELVPPYHTSSLRIRLPQVVDRNFVYAIWVQQGGEWSNATFLNAPLPQWVTPGQVGETTMLGDVSPRITTVGRNLHGIKFVRLVGEPTSSFPDPVVVGLTGVEVLESTAPETAGLEVEGYEVRATLPVLQPRTYRIELSRDAKNWFSGTATLQVAEDKPQRDYVSVADIGVFKTACHPDDGISDTPCICAALIQAYDEGKDVFFPTGTWHVGDIAACSAPVGSPPGQTRGLVVPRGVSLLGVEPICLKTGDCLWKSSVARLPTYQNRVLFNLSGHNVVAGLRFDGSAASHSEEDTALRLGCASKDCFRDDIKPDAAEVVESIAIRHNAFYKTQRGIRSGRQPIRFVTITENNFGTRAHPIRLTRGVPTSHYFGIKAPHADISLVGNVFTSTLANNDGLALLNATAVLVTNALRFDVSRNRMDGRVSVFDGPKGFRGGINFNTRGYLDMVRVADNALHCVSAQAAERRQGEAIFTDENHGTNPWPRSHAPEGAGHNWVRAEPLDRLFGGTQEKVIQSKPSTQDFADYHRGQWVYVTAGKGQGQARKIVAVDSEDWTMKVEPDWDVVPDSDSSQLFVSSGGWQVMYLRNTVDERTQCPKPAIPVNDSAPNSPYHRQDRGVIAFYGAVTDGVIANNVTQDTSGIWVDAQLGRQVHATTIEGNVLRGNAYLPHAWLAPGAIKEGGGISVFLSGTRHSSAAKRLQDHQYIHTLQIRKNRLLDAFGHTIRHKDKDPWPYHGTFTQIRVLSLATPLAGPVVRDVLYFANAFEASEDVGDYVHNGFVLAPALQGVALIDNSVATPDDHLTSAGLCNVFSPTDEDVPTGACEVVFDRHDAYGSLSTIREVSREACYTGMLGTDYPLQSLELAPHCAP